MPPLPLSACCGGAHFQEDAGEREEKNEETNHTEKISAERKKGEKPDRCGKTNERGKDDGAT